MLMSSKKPIGIMSRKVRQRNFKTPIKIHRLHEHFVHLTACGAGANGSRIGNPHKAKHRCRMCETGAKT